MKNLLIYDTETDGLNTQFCEMTSFAARQLTPELKLIDEIHLKGRIPNGVAPSPTTLLVQGEGIEQIQSQSLSSYEL